MPRLSGSLAIGVDWSLLFDRLFSPGSPFWRGLTTTIYVAILAQFFGVVLGLISSLAGMSRSRLLRLISNLYVLVYRGTPLIVQIFFLYFGANLFFGFDLFPRSFAFFSLQINGAIVAGIVALSLNEGAFMSEIIRAGISSIDRGQIEAAQSVGMTRSLAMRRIVLPQAARIIVPPLGNEFNGMIKSTSLLAFIGVYEMFLDAQIGYSRTFRPVEYFMAAGLWYLLLTSVWSLIQMRIERALGASDRDESSETIFRRIFRRTSLTPKGVR